jgi:hypothetical protein
MCTAYMSTQNRQFPSNAFYTVKNIVVFDCYNTVIISVVNTITISMALIIVNRQ